MPRLSLIVVLVLVLAGCASNDQDTSNLDLGNLEAYQQQETNKTAKQLYEQAQEDMKAGDYKAAVKSYEDLQARFPFGTYAKQAQLGIIYAYYKDEDMESTLGAAQRFIRLHPTDKRVAYAYYMRGMANMNRGHDLLSKFFSIDHSTRDPQPLEDAFSDFKKLVANYPDSEYAPDARKRMATLRDQVAEHEVAVADFYMKREAYVAAANRAKEIIGKYDGAPAVRKALTILAEAYKKLGLEGLRKDVLRVIRLNYPDHPLAKKD